MAFLVMDIPGQDYRSPALLTLREGSGSEMGLDVVVTLASSAFTTEGERRSKNAIRSVDRPSAERTGIWARICSGISVMMGLYHVREFLSS
jgi:hypothetical protein